MSTLRGADFGTGNCSMANALSDCAVYNVQITPLDGDAAEAIGWRKPASWSAGSAADLGAPEYSLFDADYSVASNPRFLTDDAFITGNEFTYEIAWPLPGGSSITRNAGAPASGTGLIGVVLSFAASNPNLPTSWFAQVQVVGTDGNGHQREFNGVGKSVSQQIELGTPYSTPLPEPGSFALAGFATLGLIWRLRGRR